MASNPSSSPTSQAPHLPQTMKPSAPPVNILPTQFARIYSLAHPAVIISLLTIRFPAVIDDPVTELLNDLPILALLQIAFVMLCLPPAGSPPKTTPQISSSSGNGAIAPLTEEKKPSATSSSISPPSTAAGASAVIRPGKIGRRRNQASHKNSSMLGSISAKLTPALLSLTLTFLLATPVLSILLVLFGAPLTTHHALTVLCAAHMAVLTSTALIYVHGVDGSVWKEVWGASRPSDAVWGGALGTCLGAWFGAVPIPLDWDRPWQAYPITILTGGYIGYAVGTLLGRSRWLFGKRVNFTSEESEKKVD